MVPGPALVGWSRREQVPRCDTFLFISRLNRKAPPRLSIRSISKLPDINVLTSVEEYHLIEGNFLRLNMSQTQLISFGGRGDSGASLLSSSYGNIVLFDIEKFLGVHLDDDILADPC